MCVCVCVCVYVCNRFASMMCIVDVDPSEAQKVFPLAEMKSMDEDNENLKSGGKKDTGKKRKSAAADGKKAASAKKKK